MKRRTFLALAASLGLVGISRGLPALPQPGLKPVPPSLGPETTFRVPVATGFQVGDSVTITGMPWSKESVLYVITEISKGVGTRDLITARELFGGHAVSIEETFEVMP